MEQSLSWTLRTIQTMRFKIIVKYLAPVETSGGRFSVIVNKTRFEQAVLSRAGVITRELGSITLPAGTHRLQALPVLIAKDELMKLLEIQLIPI
jgi:hypothetical protein